MAKLEAQEVEVQCAYCDGLRYHPPGTERPENYCQCKYRFMRMGGSGFELQTTVMGRTVADMRKDIMEHIDRMKPDAPVAFKFSVTRLDEEKIAKAAVKRRTKRVANKLLGK